MKYKNMLVAFDEDGNDYGVGLFCFKSNEDALEFWRLTSTLPVQCEKLMFPIMVVYDGNDEETISILNTLFHVIFDRELYSIGKKNEEKE